MLKERCRNIFHLTLWTCLVVPALIPGDLYSDVLLEESSYSCVLCHSDVKSRYLEDIHYRRGIACDICHGGDPLSFDVEGAKAPGTGYRGKPSKVEGVDICSSCHSDEEMMRQYGLSTDQYKNYLTSEHGKLLLEKGDQKVAACIDCHGVHQILPPTNPASKVYRKNLPATCASCHSKVEYMKEYSIPTTQYDDYLHSVHGVELIENNNRAVPECARCHGVHGARAPGTTEVYNVCGQCHTYIREQFMKSAHFEAEKEGLINGCEACHGDHRITRATTELYTDVCVDCHSTESEPYMTGIEIKKRFDQAWSQYGEGMAELDRATVEGLWVMDEELIMGEVRTLLISLRTSQHAMDPDKIEDEISKALSMIHGVIQTIEHKLVSIRIYKLVLIPIWIFLGGMIVLFYTELKRSARRA